MLGVVICVLIPGVVVNVMCVFFCAGRREDGVCDVVWSVVVVLPSFVICFVRACGCLIVSTVVYNCYMRLVRPAAQALGVLVKWVLAKTIESMRSRSVASSTGVALQWYLLL